MSPFERGHLLVVVPHATRTGSTKVLLELLRRLPAESDIGIDLLLQTGGSLAQDLLGVGSGAVDGPPAAVLVNSVLAAGAVLDHAGTVPVAVYLHESADVLATLPEDAVAGLLRADRVWCVSDQVRDDAVAFGVAADRTLLLPPLIAPVPSPDPESVDAARRSMGVGGRDRLVLACGEVRWGKGPDLFVEVARALGTDDLRYAWIGRRQRAFARQLDHDLAVLGLTDHLRWMGDVAEPAPYLAAADLIVMPSRDDPQPLVPLEAAQLGVPTVAFASGGLADLGAAGAALVAPYPDVGALADLARVVLADPERGRGLVAAARTRIDERQSSDVLMPRFVAALHDLGAGGRS